MEDLTRHYLISGRVQGVGFRAFVRREAVRLHLRGWVRNLHDGRVESLAQGRASILVEFERRIRSGLPAAHVNALVVSRWSDSVSFDDFEIGKDSEKPCWTS